MKRNKTLLISLLSLIFVLSVAFACFSFACGKKNSGDGNETDGGNEEQPPKIEYTDGDYTLLDFESPQDLYKVRPYIDDILDMYGKITIEENEEVARSGKGFLKFAYVSGKDPAVVFYPAHSDYPDIPVDRLSSFGISVYSAAEEDKKVTLAIVSGSEPVYSEEKDLVPGWNDYVFELDPILMKFRSDEIVAFCVSTARGEACDFYFDKWTATIGGAELTEVQKTALAFVEETDKLKTGTPSAETLLKAYDYYGKLDEACRSAVAKHYDDYLSAVSRFLDARSWDDDSLWIHLSEDYGVLQLAETASITYEYVADAFGEGNGGTTFTFDGFKPAKEIEEGEEPTAVSAQIKFNVTVTTSTIVTDRYDYVEFDVKNESDKTVSMCVNGSTYVITLLAGESVTANVPVTDFVESGNLITVTFDYVEGQTEKAKVSLSSVCAKTVSRENIYETALDGGKYSGGGNVTVKAEGNKYALDISDAEAKISVNKKYNDINVSQNVLMSAVSDKNVTLGLYDSQGTLITKYDLSEVASVIILDKEEYKALSYFKAEGTGKITLSDMLLSRTVDNDYLEIILKNDYVVGADKLTADNVREAVYFLSSFESMGGYKQNRMRSDDADVYADIKARAVKVSEIFKTAVSKLDDNTATETEGMLILDLSGTYSLLSTVTPFTDSEEDIIKTAKKTTLLKYKYTVFDFDDPMATSKFKQDVKWVDWSGSLSVEDFDGGKKLAIGVRKVMAEGQGVGNPRRIWVTYDISSISSVLNGYDYVTWRFYNANVRDCTIFFITYGWSGTVARYTLKANRWTDVKFGINDFKSAVSFVIYPADPGDKFYVDNAYACSVEYVQGLVNDIPAIEDITSFDREKIEFARAEYEKLSALAKKKINVDKIVVAEEMVSKLPSYVFSMSGENAVKKFANPGEFYDWKGTFSVENDATQGNVLSINTVGNPTVVYVEYKIGTDLSDYSFVTFKVYNPTSKNLNFAVIKRGYEKSFKNATLAPGAWTEITMSVADFKAAGYFYFADLRDVPANSKIFITDVIAHGVKSVQYLIDKLPDADTVTLNDMGTVVSARKYYDSLLQNEQEKVNANKLVECENALKNIPYGVFDMSSEGVTGKFGNPGEFYTWNGTFSIENDETYGKVLSINVSGQPTVVYVGYDLGNIDLSDYSRVTFKVYNPTSKDLNFAVIKRGYEKSYKNATLAPGAWTEITMSATDFKSAGYFYFADLRSAPENVSLLITSIEAYM